ncbi:MAG: cache domain-containing protein [Ginsengibacter sp.]
MKFSFSRNHAAVLITLMFVIFLGATYFFIYVPDNEKVLQEQRFRTLQNIENNIHEKIENSIALMNNLLKDTLDPEYIRYLSDQSKSHFTLMLPAHQTEKFPVKKINDSGYIINVNNLNREITLLLTKRNINGTDTTNYSMAMKWSFKQFMEFLPQNIFDQYIIFSNKEIVYETFPSGISDFKDSLLDNKNGFVTSAVKGLNVSGKDYRLFSQPVNITPKDKWVITGLLSNNRYQQERNQLPVSIVILLVTVLIIIIVVFPWVKLYQMGNKDRLTIIDGISSIAVSMLLMSLLFFTFFKYNALMRPDISPNSKDTLATQITTAFQKEIDTAYQKLQSFDDFLKNHYALFSNDIVNLDKENIEYRKLVNGNGSNRDSLKALLEIARTINLYQVYWLDTNGTEKINWTTEGMNAPHGHFKTRDYFKKITPATVYTLHNDTNQKFYLDQLISWTSGSFRSVVSFSSKVPGQAVAAMSFNMRSLNKPVLPEGYGFAIIDNNGKVRYHSNPSSNLNENLVEEFSESEKLTSCLKARTEGVFETKYFSTEYTVAVKPIERLPYFIVIFEDTSYKETRDMEIYSFTFSMMLLLFGFLILQLFIIFLVSSKRSFFKKQLYDTSWIGPKKISHNEYNLATLTNVIIILLALSFFHLSTFLAYLYILMFSVIFISVFLTGLFARRYKRLSQQANYQFKITTLRWLFIICVIINVAAIRTLDNNNLAVLLIYELLIVLVGWICYKFGSNILKGVNRLTGNSLLSKWNYAQSFSLMALTRLIITSGIPVVFFYITSYDYEQNISIRYRQLQYANKLLDILSDKQLTGINSNDNFAKGFYYDGAWIKNIDTVSLYTNDKKINTPHTYSHEENITAKILGLFRVNFTDNAINEEKFFTAHEADTLFFFNPLLKDACKNDSATITLRHTRQPGQYLKITASGLNYKLPSVFSNASFNGFVFWVLFFVALVTFYFIIYSVISKLFCLGLPDLSALKDVDEKILTNPILNGLLFVIGLPGSGKLSIIKEKIEKGEILNNETPLVYKEDDDASSNVFIADFINIPGNGDDRESGTEWKTFKANVYNKKNKLIIINHFEYNIKDPVANRIKLNFLQGLMLDNNCKIIVLSTIHPVAFLDSVVTQPAKGTEKPESIQDFEKWNILLGHYRIIVLPLQRWTIDIDKPFQTSHEEISKEIYKETRYTHFLGKLHDDTIAIAKDLLEKKIPVNPDELALVLQVSSHYFYMYIWQSLTKEEKFLLYDLAEDNLVNSFDDYNLNMLLAKGVIVRMDGTLRLFNKGFRNFILTAIGNSEAMKIKNTIKDNGNWSRLKNPLLILVLAILTFLLTSQQEAYSRLITYVAALATGVPMIIKLFSIFDKNSPKSG